MANYTSTHTGQEIDKAVTKANNLILDSETLSSLQTTNKDSLISAVNEVANKLTGITKIEVVTEYPATKEEGVLYLKVES